MVSTQTTPIRSIFEFQKNVIEASRRSWVRRLFLLDSIHTYPKFAE